MIDSPSKLHFLASEAGCPMAKKIPIGSRTPMGVLEAGWPKGPRFLLESTRRGGGLGRYSFTGGKPYRRFESRAERVCLEPNRGDPLLLAAVPSLRQLLTRESVPTVPGLPPFQGGAVGYFGYEWAHQWEAFPARQKDDLGLPDVELLFIDLLAAFDHAEGVLWLIFNPGGERFGSQGRQALWDEGEERIASLENRLGAPLPDPRCLPLLQGEGLLPQMTRDAYIEKVSRCQEYICSGDIFQANLSHRFSMPLGSTCPLALYQRLSEINPSPFAAYLETGNVTLLGASPERLIQRSGPLVSTRPIAGTRRRGLNSEDDRRLARELLGDPKERAEHIMLVDLERNDLGKICRFGSVRVDEWMDIERYSHVLHIVSNITGELRPDRDAVDLLQATFPGGTVTGVPKIRCMEIIDELEPVTRGPYTGALGYLSTGGEMDLSIVIRTLIATREVLYLQVGAGIVADSVPSREYEETISKAAAAMAALSRNRAWSSSGRI